METVLGVELIEVRRLAHIVLGAVQVEVRRVAHAVNPVLGAVQTGGRRAD